MPRPSNSFSRPRPAPSTGHAGRVVAPAPALAPALAFALVLAALAPTGCASWGKVPVEGDFAAIQPGMTRDEVVARVGRPQWTFGVRQENLTILNYRYNHNDCTIFQVSLRPDGTVKDIAPAYDPACDGGWFRL